MCFTKCCLLVYERQNGFNRFALLAEKHLSYKLTHDCYNKIQLPLPFNHANTRGHCFKLLVNRNTKDPRRNFFTERICQDWNKLPNNITEAESLTIFKHRLDDHLSKKHFEID